MCAQDQDYDANMFTSDSAGGSDDYGQVEVVSWDGVHRQAIVRTATTKGQNAMCAENFNQYNGFNVGANYATYANFNLESDDVDDEGDLKREVNNFVWTHAPGDMTLDAAEALAVKIFDLFVEARKADPATDAQ